MGEGGVTSAGRGAPEPSGAGRNILPPRVHLAQPGDLGPFAGSNALREVRAEFR